MRFRPTLSQLRPALSAIGATCAMLLPLSVVPAASAVPVTVPVTAQVAQSNPVPVSNVVPAMASVPASESMARAAVSRHVPKPNSKRCGTDDYARKGVGRAGVLHVRVYRNGNPCAWFELNRAIYGLPKSKRPTSGVQICLSDGKGGCAASGPRATDIGRYRVYAGPVVFPPLPPVPGIYHVLARASSCKPGVKFTFGSRKGCQRATITTRVRVF